MPSEQNPLESLHLLLDHGPLLDRRADLAGKEEVFLSKNSSHSSQDHLNELFLPRVFKNR